MTRALLFLHLVGAAVWLGGSVTVGAVVPVLRKAGVGRPHLQVMARQFGRVSWAAMAVSVVTGPALVARTGREWGDLNLKAGLVLLVIAIAVTHQLTARNSPPAVRGAVESLILVITLAIFYVATGV